MTKFRNTSDISDGAALTVLGICILSLFAWVTHIVWIIKTLASPVGATFGQMALGAIGAFMPPVGVVHGFMIWFGVGA